MIPCEVNNLNKLYGNLVGVDNITFNVKEGEIFGLVGPNGAGKTTTLRTIMGLLKPTEGNVSVINEDAFKNGHIARKEIGYVSGEASYIPNLTVKQNLEFVAETKGVPMDRVDELATKLELTLSMKAKDLSLGNKKKMNIVMALLSSPKLIILDEPTMGLDPLVRQNFIKLMEEEKKRGASIIISSHELNEVQRLCDRVAIIKEGKIVAIEEMQNLKTKRLKKVTLETTYSTPQVTLSGVSDLKQDGTLTTFNYNGDMKKLVDYLNSVDVENVNIEECNLESIFMHFYE